MVQGDYARVFGLTPEAGRMIEAGDAGPAARVCVISDQLWRQWFDRDRAVLGQTAVTVNEQSLTVVGVAPRGFRGLSPGFAASDVWVPSAVLQLTDPTLESRPDLKDRRSRTDPRARASGRASRGGDSCGAVALRSHRRQRLARLPCLRRPWMGVVPIRSLGAHRARHLVSVGARAARGVREPGESALRPRHEAAERNRHAAVAGRGASRRVSIVRRRSRDHRRARRGRRPLARACRFVARRARVCGSSLLPSSPSVRGANALLSADLAPDWTVLAYAVFAGALTAVLVGGATAWRASRVPPARTLAGLRAGRRIDARRLAAFAKGSSPCK